MKFYSLVIGLMVIGSVSGAGQALVDCEAVEVIDSFYLEESLSVEEYPEVSVLEDAFGSKEAWLGISLYSEGDGDTITSENSVGFDRVYTIDPTHRLEQYQIIVTGAPMNREGELLGRNRKSADEQYGEWDLIALLTCK